jgi:hypothetical protein
VFGEQTASGFSGDIVTQIGTIGHTWMLTPSVVTGHFGLALKTDTLNGLAGGLSADRAGDTRDERAA